MNQHLRVLVVEDDPNDVELTLRELRRGGYDVTHERVEDREGMRAALKREMWDLVIADYSLPRFSAPEALRLLKESGIDLPFVIVSGNVSDETAVHAMKAGAHDYLMKGNLARLVPAVARELKEAKVREEGRRAQEKIWRLAYYDTLTGLPNRALLYDRLQHAMLARQDVRRRAALLLLNLDHFRDIDNTLGHRIGDLLLQQVGPRVSGALRNPDATVARIGGDEFALLLPETGSGDAVRIAQALLKAMEESFVVEEMVLDIGASIGIALFPDHGDDAELLIRRAHVALHLAKRTRGDYAVYAPDRDPYTPRRLVLMGELRHAINDGHLFLLYQPKVNLRTGRVTGVEALVRWDHPHLGVVPPDQFIALSEHTGLIKPLTLWVLDAALRQRSQWDQDHLEISVAVNLSFRNLQDPQLPDQVALLLQNRGVAPDRLDLEITESTLMADPARAMESLGRLDGMGIKLSIDDFGTGYSSLGYLKKLPVGAIKVDRSFVSGMERSRDDAVIVRSTIDLAHNLGLKVVAEGVESRGVLEKLIALGCDEAQGYHISAPLPPSEVTRWFYESSWGLKAGSGEPGSRAA